MTHAKEITASVDLKQKVRVESLVQDSFEYKRENVKEFKFQLLEIKTKEPPTNLEFHICDMVGNHYRFNLLQYRMKFIFQDGYYSLDLSELEEFKMQKAPWYIVLSNERDADFSAKIFYKYQIEKSIF